jgi:hypothetical protein
MTNVTSQYWLSNFRFKFEFDGNGGNNIFLDDINIYSGAPSNTIVAGIEETEIAQALNVYPNPSEGELNVNFTVNNPKTLNFVITDVLGKEIQAQRIEANTGTNLVMLSTEGISKGMYLLTIGEGTNKQVVQFMVK